MNTYFSSVFSGYSFYTKNNPYFFPSSFVVAEYLRCCLCNLVYLHYFHKPKLEMQIAWFPLLALTGIAMAWICKSEWSLHAYLNTGEDSSVIGIAAVATSRLLKQRHNYIHSGHISRKGLRLQKRRGRAGKFRPFWLLNNYFYQSYTELNGYLYSTMLMPNAICQIRTPLQHFSLDFLPFFPTKNNQFESNFRLFSTHQKICLKKISSSFCFPSEYHINRCSAFMIAAESINLNCTSNV